jgi:hypothetical protein
MRFAGRLARAKAAGSTIVDCCGINAREPATNAASANGAAPVRGLGRTPARDGASAAPGWKRASALIAAALVALVPKCPACWSVYAGLSNLLGVSIALDVRFLQPLTLAALVVALVGVSVNLRRSGYLPLAAAAVCALGIWLGKFVLQHDVLWYASSCGLLLAAFAGRRARRGATRASSELAEHTQAG